MSRSSWVTGFVRQIDVEQRTTTTATEGVFHKQSTTRTLDYVSMLVEMPISGGESQFRAVFATKSAEPQLALVRLGDKITFNAQYYGQICQVTVHFEERGKQA